MAIRVQPNARKAKFTGIVNGELKLAVTAPPEDGRANQAVIELISDALQIRRSQVEIIKGQTNRSKVVLLKEVSEESIRTALSLIV